MKPILLLLLSFSTGNLIAQADSYSNLVKKHRQIYVRDHEVVQGKDASGFSFFAPSKEYLVTASFTPINDTIGFLMKTTGAKTPKYFRYGKLSFKIRDTSLTLTVFRNEQLSKTEEYKYYLFLPYTDLTSGNESYGGGKYLDLDLRDIKDGKIVIDFNLAYNPYCVYASGYNCPLPMAENDLAIEIKAGEKLFRKKQ